MLWDPSGGHAQVGDVAAWSYQCHMHIRCAGWWPSEVQRLARQKKRTGEPGLQIWMQLSPNHAGLCALEGAIPPQGRAPAT